MMPDMTPWSYPNRKTPNETKILVKYLSHLGQLDSDGTQVSGHGRRLGDTQKRLAHQAVPPRGFPIAARHDEGNNPAKPGDWGWTGRGNFDDELFVAEFAGVAVVAGGGVVVVVVYVVGIVDAFGLLPARPGTGVGVVRWARDLERILFAGQLFGQVSGITPDGEIRID